jgi:hypothetical protein
MCPPEVKFLEILGCLIEKGTIAIKQGDQYDNYKSHGFVKILQEFNEDYFEEDRKDVNRKYLAELMDFWHDEVLKSEGEPVEPDDIDAVDKIKKYNDDYKEKRDHRIHVITALEYIFGNRDGVLENIYKSVERGEPCGGSTPVAASFHVL